MAGKHLVKFFQGTSDQYRSITPDAYTFYFLTDINRIYLGSTQLSNNQIWQQVDYLKSTKAEIQIKTTAEWAVDGLQISQKGTFYIYSDRATGEEDSQGNIQTYPGVKIGDGGSFITDLPFVDDLFYSHIQNTNIHVTPEQKDSWSNKITTDDSVTIGQNLIFTRN